MAKRPHRKPRSPAPHDGSRRKLWLLGGGVCAILLVVLLLIARSFFHEDHSHEAGPHGGVIVSLGDDDDHYHIEVVREKGGTLKLYTFGEEVEEPIAVESQTVAAEISAETDEEPITVLLMPVPCASDAQGKTSQFTGKLPEVFWGRRLKVSIPSIVMEGKRFSATFALSNGHNGEKWAENARTEEELYLSPEGRYTEADIRANGRLTASKKYREFKANHDEKPRSGDRICPVSRLKAQPRCTWIVGGNPYEFCCPPCIDEFLKRAKYRPREVREPEEYVEK